MPVGKVKWYDAVKGYGFLSQEGGPDVHVRADALPDGVATLRTGDRVEFGIVQGRKGDQALQVRILEPAPSVARNQANARRKPAEDMVVIVEDLIRLLESLEAGYRRGKHPDPKAGKAIAALLHALADELS